ncbi:AraC-type DNA-binding protein [Paenibacillus sp. UNCCL117]|uniref:helix-turn-helix transcriptional regulator n=1 Tax=unclassified Paenibacillus TaxID=185978 RepID=UPI000890AF13|nr:MULTISPECIES: AraC family transcriptional regulator [unclassified Paenibacillus]SDD07863.1 AraC-type DNA-binding protein [Paenibacillus sp. cl123]SFW31355.1 AraC-type DNA-binding protein [Paenibacillus sp. UNCCL117]
MEEYEYEYADFIYYTPRELDKAGQLWPIRGGRSIAKPNYKVGPKRIDCYSLHLVQEGEIWLEFQGRRARVGAGHLFCLFPGLTYHYSIAALAAPLRFSWIALDGPRVRELLQLAGLSPEAPYRQQVDYAGIGEIIAQMHGLMGQAASWKPGVSLELQSLLLALFARMTPELAPKPETEPAGWIRSCIDFMELHAAEGVSVQQVAAYAGVHRSYFSSVFTREVGLSPLGYLQKIRMEKAKQLLRETDAAVTEIALSLGYPSLFSFTRAFKNYCRMSPALFRGQK